MNVIARLFQRRRIGRVVREMKRAHLVQKQPSIALLGAMGGAASQALPDLVTELKGLASKEAGHEKGRKLCSILRKAILNVGGDEGQKAINRLVVEFLRGLGHTPPEKSNSILFALGGLGSDAAVPALRDALTSSNDKSVTGCAIKALWMIGTKNAAQALLDKFDDLWRMDKNEQRSNPRTTKCAQALGLLRFKPAASRLEDHLLDPKHTSHGSLQQVAHALGQILGQDAEGKLQEILSRIPDTDADGDPALRGTGADDSSQARRRWISSGIEQRADDVLGGCEWLVH